MIWWRYHSPSFPEVLQVRMMIEGDSNENWISSSLLPGRRSSMHSRVLLENQSRTPSQSVPSLSPTMLPQNPVDRFAAFFIIFQWHCKLIHANVSLPHPTCHLISCKMYNWGSLRKPCTFLHSWFSYGSSPCVTCSPVPPPYWLRFRDPQKEIEFFSKNYYIRVW